MQESCHQSDAQKGLSAGQLCTGGSQEGTGLLGDKNRAASWRLLALTNLYQLVTVSGVSFTFTSVLFTCFGSTKEPQV